MTQLITRKALEAAKLLKVEQVYVEELGGDIRLRQMSAADVSRFAEAGEKMDEDGSMKNVKLTGLLLALTWVDADDKPIFTGEDDLQILLQTLPLEVLNRLGELAAEQSGLSPDSAIEAKKNLELTAHSETGIT